MSKQAYIDARKQLRMYAVELLATIDESLPAEVDPVENPDFANPWDEPLRSIAGRIDDVAGSFDFLQGAFGVPRNQTRHRRFLEGKFSN